MPASPRLATRLLRDVRGDENLRSARRRPTAATGAVAPGLATATGVPCSAPRRDHRIVVHVAPRTSAISTEKEQVHRDRRATAVTVRLAVCVLASSVVRLSCWRSSAWRRRCCSCIDDRTAAMATPPKTPAPMKRAAPPPQVLHDTGGSPAPPPIESSAGERWYA